MKKALRRDLITAIADKAFFTELQAETALEAVSAVLREAMLSGKQVKLQNFGSFTPTDKPATKKKVVDTVRNIPARLNIKFVSSGGIQDDYRLRKGFTVDVTGELSGFRKNLS